MSRPGGTTEEYLRAIAEHTFDWESWIGADGRLRWINPAVERITGVSPEDCMRMPDYPLPLIHPDDQQMMLKHLADARSGCSGNDIVFRVARPDAAVKWASISWQPFTASDGTSLGYRTSIRDITDRKIAEDALRDREQHLRFALEASLAIVFEWDIREDRIRRIMSSAKALPETSDDLGCFEDVLRAVHPDDRAAFRAAVETALTSTTGRYHSIHRVVDQTGTVAWLEEYGGVEYGDDGKPLRFLGIAFNIDERKRAEDRLRESEERQRHRAAELEAILDTAPIGIAIADATGRRIRGNRAHEQIFGLAPGAEFSLTAGSPPSFRVQSAGHDLAPKDLPMQRAVRGETVVGQELEIIGSHGDAISVFASAKPLLDENREPRGAVGAFLDITARKAVETSLRAANDTFRNLIEHSPFGIYIVDAAFRLVQVSDGARRAFQNIHPLIGRDFSEVMRTIWTEPFATEAINRFRHTLATGETFRASRTAEMRADTGVVEAYDWQIERIALPDGTPAVVCNFYDLSDRIRHEEHTKLLMREINHRSKNMLSLVQSIATLTISKNSEEFVTRFGERIKSLAAAHDLLVEGQWRSVQVVNLVRSQLSHFADLIGTRIEASGPALSLKPHAAQSIGMALHELATNAAKYGALSNDRGRVSITWSIETETPRDGIFSMSWIESGGPPVEEPKRCGFGTSVTTSMVKMSVQGDVSVLYRSSGLEWTLTCPKGNALEFETVARGAQPAMPPPSLQPKPRGKRILVVEDEPLIAMEMSAFLTEAGFELVGPASNVSQALALLDTLGCDAAVLDVNLGSETSDPIARRLCTSKIPFVAISGYGRDQLPPSFDAVPLVGKPLISSSLIATLKQCFIAR